MSRDSFPRIKPHFQHKTFTELPKLHKSHSQSTMFYVSQRRFYRKSQTQKYLSPFKSPK